MIINGTVLGDREVVVRLRTLEDAVRVRVLAAVKGLTYELQDRVVRTKLSGQVLKRRSGNLSQHIYAKVEETANSVTGLVGTNVPYGRVHEYGYHGPQHVRAFTRVVNKIFGKPVNPTVQHVGAFTRNINIPARPFLRPSLEEMRETIHTRITNAVKQAARAI